MTSDISYVGVSHPNVLERKPWTTLSDTQVDVAILCLWPAIGLVLTALVFAFGFGEELIQALAVSG
jgi:hypothetical protein